jgi:soluble lytic murein transglycosylase-like protein
MPVKSQLENRGKAAIFKPVASQGAEDVGVGFRMRIVCRTAVVALLACAPTSVAAEGLNLTGSTKSRSAIFKSQGDLIEKKLSKQYSGSVKFTPKYKKGEASADAKSIPSYRGSYKGEYLEVAKAAARKHGVPEDLFLRLVQQESGWNPVAVSTKGATGLAQLMPGTAEKLGVDIADPGENLDGGARYLRMMFDKFGTWELALAAYNAGPGAVEEHDGIPPYAETENYVKAILG